MAATRSERMQGFESSLWRQDYWLETFCSHPKFVKSGQGKGSAKGGLPIPYIDIQRSTRGIGNG